MRQLLKEHSPPIDAENGMREWRRKSFAVPARRRLDPSGTNLPRPAKNNAPKSFMGGVWAAESQDRCVLDYHVWQQMLFFIDVMETPEKRVGITRRNLSRFLFPKYE